MEIMNDGILMESHPKYKDYKKKVLKGKLAAGESITVITKDIEGKETTRSFTAEFSNCHFKLVVQDKGEKRQDND
jgi:TusA-related sulfurtransferase